MLNSGKKIRDKKNKYSNSCVFRKKNSERNKKPFLKPRGQFDDGVLGLRQVLRWSYEVLSLFIQPVLGYVTS